MDYEMLPDELHMYEKLYELMGSRVRITSDRTVYQGIIGTIIPGLRMVSLRHTSLISGEYLGIIRFRFREITSLTVVESGEIVNRYPKNDYLLDIIKNKAGQKYNINDVLFDGQLSDVSDDEVSVDEESKDRDFTLELPPHLKNQLPSDSIVIDCMDENFAQAVQHISKQSVIGISFEGPQVSRFGKLTILSISTVSHVYLFEIKSLKNEAFDNGLRDILEESSIKKVIHDCRFPSDCLAHQYSTQLTNVFDTQVADFIISMQCYNDKYEFKYVSSLDCCVTNHLQVPPEFLHRLSNVKEKDHFMKRPICNEFNDIIKNTIYLILLYETLSKKLLDPLHKNVNVYLRVLANATEEEINTLGNELSPPDSIPLTNLMYGIQTVRFKKFQKKSLVSLECKFINPKTGQIIEPEKKFCFEDTPLKTYMNSKAERQLTDEINKENSLLQMKSLYQKGNLRSMSIKSIESPLEKSYDTFQSITVQPSSRHLDEVYHKLVNNLTLRSHQSESVFNVKPSSNYVSVFTVRKPFSDYSTQNSDTSKEPSTCQDVECTSEHLCTAKDISATLYKDSSDSSDFWLKLCASSDGQNATSLEKKYKNIKFVPA